MFNKVIIDPKHEFRCYINAEPQEYFGRALRLGYLFYLANRGHKAAQQALKIIQEHLTPDKLQRVIQGLTSAKKEELVQNDSKTRATFFTFKRALLRNDHWARLLTVWSIVHLGQNEELYRWAMYRLIQKFNPNTFQIPLVLLESTSVQQSSEAFSALVEKIPTLPIASLTEMASTVRIARKILLDISSHAQRFELAQLLIHKHKILAKEVAVAWKRSLETNALERKEEETLKTYANMLAKKYREFKDVSKVSRLKRSCLQIEHPIVQTNHLDTISRGWFLMNIPTILTFSQTAQAGISATLLGTSGPTLGAVAYSAGIAASTLFLPLFAVASIGALIVHTKKKEVSGTIVNNYISHNSNNKI